MSATPEGFRLVKGPQGTLWLLREGVPFDLGPERWDGWLAGKEGAILTREGGRSPARRLNLPGIGEVVVRRYQHGGALAGITRNRFLGIERALLEIRASERLRQRGVLTPEILAVYSRRSSAGFRQACLLCRFVPGGENLREWIRGRGGPSTDWKPILRDVARAISSLHAAGCHHRDLNLSNLLLASRRIWILDLDGARLDLTLGVPERGRSLLRLYRSLWKESGRREPLSSRERIQFLRHYADEDTHLFQDLLDWSNRHWRGHAFRRKFSVARIKGSR